MELNSPLSVYCFDRSFISGIKWLTLEWMNGDEGTVFKLCFIHKYESMQKLITTKHRQTLENKCGTHLVESFLIFKFAVIMWVSTLHYIQLWILIVVLLNRNILCSYDAWMSKTLTLKRGVEVRLYTSVVRTLIAA